MTFELQLSRLRELLREKVKQGLVTERGMAKATGTSQPHLHNVLKGIRALPPELADRLMIAAGVTIQDLLRELPASEDMSTRSTPISFSGGTMERRSCYLAEDARMEPRFQPGDLVFFDASEPARLKIESNSVYLVNFLGQDCARYVRRGGSRLYLASEESLSKPADWEFVSLSGKLITDVVKGRIIWICRQIGTDGPGGDQRGRPATSQ